MKTLTALTIAAVIALSPVAASAAPKHHGGGQKYAQKHQPKKPGFHKNNRYKNAHWMKRGGKLPGWQRGHRVDYRMHKLNKPPRGHEWRRIDNNFVLVALTTGIIASVIGASR
ncbi:MAG: RcnB family protein [Stappiaceae bacterium]